MKKNPVLLSAVAAFILMSSVALAGSGVAMKIHVPFDFYVGDQLMQAGVYSFEMGSGPAAIASIVKIRSERSAGIIALTTPGLSGTELDQLRFNQYGEKCFLSAVSIRGFEANFKMLKLERELRTRIEKIGSTILVAEK
jgi:hypothetical protein